MVGDFLHLNGDAISRWPELDTTTISTRRWFPGFSISSTAVVSAVVFTRLYLQIKKNNTRLAVDDALILVGWFLGVLLATLCVIGTLRYGFDRHIWDVSQAVYNPAALIQWLSEGAFVLSTCFTKISVLLSFCRLATPRSTSFRRITYGCIIFIACTTFADLLFLIFQCRPISASWTVPDSASPTPASCLEKDGYYPIHGSLTCFTTAYTILIPNLLLRNTPMTSLRRIGLRSIILGSCSIIGAGITRTVFLYRLATSANGDATWNGFNVFIFAHLEAQLAIIFASLPFLHHFLPSRPNFFICNNTVSTPQPPLRATSVIEPERVFESPVSPPGTIRPSIEMTYERYTQGSFGPPVPPKDLGVWLERYQRDHGEMARGYPF